MNQKAQSIHINFDGSGGFTLQPNDSGVNEGMNISTASAGKGNNITSNYNDFLARVATGVKFSTNNSTGFDNLNRTTMAFKK